MSIAVCFEIFWCDSHSVFSEILVHHFLKNSLLHFCTFSSEEYSLYKEKREFCGRFGPNVVIYN